MNAMKVLCTIREYFFGSKRLPQSVLDEHERVMRRSCRYCDDVATRVVYHTHDSWDTPAGTTNRGAVIYVCNKPGCITKSKEHDSLRCEEYPWPFPKAA